VAHAGHGLIRRELAGADLVDPDSRVDLGKVSTGVAVRAGSPSPKIGDTDGLRETLLGATKIVCPDPAIATAGKVVMALLEKIGVREQTENRMQLFPNGYAAMKWLGEEGAASDVGITQVTEILPNTAVSFVGALPDEFQMKTVYSAAIAMKAQAAALAKDFVQRFAGAAARPLLERAGYEL